MANQALGMIETKGFVCLLEAVDSMLKAANVKMLGWDKVGSGLCDKEMPTVRKFADGRQIKCHLPGSVLDVNTPVTMIVGE